MELKNIAILGPGGNVGTAILHELLQPSSSPPTTITLITRPTSNYTTPAPPSNSSTTLIHKTADYTSLNSLQTAFSAQDAIVNCITGSATQYTTSRLILDAAIAAGVKFFFANEFVGNIQSKRYWRLPEEFVGAKVRMRKDMEDLAEMGRIKWTSLNGGPFADMWLMKGPAGFSLPTTHARIYGTGNTPLYWTPLPVIARAAVYMLQNPEPIVNRAIHICPFVAHRGERSSITQRILLQTLEDVLGKKFSTEQVDVEEIWKRALDVLEMYRRGEPGGEQIALAVKGLSVSNQFYEEDQGEDGDAFSSLVENNTVGVQVMSVEEAVREAVERYGGDCKVVEGMFKVEACKDLEEERRGRILGDEFVCSDGES